jgi:hypothetical protein
MASMQFIVPDNSASLATNVKMPAEADDTLVMLVSVDADFSAGYT